MGDGSGVAPSDFAQQLLDVLEPGAAEAAASTLQQALGLHDAQLAEFLSAFAQRVRSSTRPVSAAELRQILAGVSAEAAARLPG